MHSLNLASIRVLVRTGLERTIGYLARFGFESADLPHSVSLALGTPSVSPLALARAYAVFANGGRLVDPVLIARVADAGERVQEREAVPSTPASGTGGRLPVMLTAGDGGGLAGKSEVQVSDQVITPQNAYLISSMLRDVIRRGTGRAARALDRSDIAGKTGTTNRQRDAWFAGFHRNIAAVAWVGFDRMRPLGFGETGSRAALPMWMEFMRVALARQPQRWLSQPPGLVRARIDPESGRLTSAENTSSRFEVFRAERLRRLVRRRELQPLPSGAHPARALF